MILGWLTLRGELCGRLKTQNLMGRVWRGVLGSAAMGLTFIGLSILPLLGVTAIWFATPIFTLILAALILRELIRFIGIGAVLIGLVVVSIMLWPRLNRSNDIQDNAKFAAILIPVATMGPALVQIQIRALVRTEAAASIAFYFSVIASTVFLFTRPFGWIFSS